jgi:hypothetical protein
VVDVEDKRWGQLRPIKVTSWVITEKSMFWSIKAEMSTAARRWGSFSARDFPMRSMILFTSEALGCVEIRRNNRVSNRRTKPECGDMR